MSTTPTDPGPQDPRHQPPATPAPQPPHPGYQQAPTYPGAAAPVKPAKPWFKRWWVWLLIVIGVLVVAAALGGGGDDSAEQATQTTAASSSAPSTDDPAPKETSEAPAEEPPADLTLDDGWTMESDSFAVYVEGYVSNNTDADISNYVQITFDALDANGANLGTCLDNANTIDAGGKWKFKAICLDNADEVAEVRFKEITGF